MPPELTLRWDALPERERDLLTGRLRRAADAAHQHPAVWPDGPAGLHRGRHRAIVADLWLLYRVNEDHRTLSVLGFGRVLRDGGALL